ERLRLRYRAHDGTASRRLVEPHRLVHTGRRWYLVAYDTDRAGWRTFRVDRIEPPVTTDRRFVPRPPPAEDVAAYVAQSVAAARAAPPPSSAANHARASSSHWAWRSWNRSCARRRGQRAGSRSSGRSGSRNGNLRHSWTSWVCARKTASAPLGRTRPKRATNA